MIVNAKQSASKSKVIASWSESRHRAKTQLKQSKLELLMIWGSNRSKFKTPEEDYKDKKICVTGKITAYDGVPEIIADDPKQIRIE